MFMSNQILTIAVVIPLLCSVGCSPETAASHLSTASVSSTNDLTVVISPLLKDRPALINQVLDWSVPQPNLPLAFLDGLEATEIASAQVPRVDNFSKETVLYKLRKPLGNLVRWSQEDGPNSSATAPSGALSIPKILARLQQSAGHPKYLVFIGSPVLQFPNDPALDFRVPRFRYPSDGHFLSTTSPFSCLGRETSLSGTTVVMVFPKEDTSAWPGNYEEQLHGFYSRLIAKRGGTLAAFTPDLGSALRALTHGGSPAMVWPEVTSNEASAEPEMIDSVVPGVRKPDQLRATNVVDVVKTNPAPVDVVQTTTVTNIVTNIVTSFVFTNLPPPDPAPQPLPVAVVRPSSEVTVSIRYLSTSAVCDLRVTPFVGAEEISLEKAVSRLGKYSANVDLETGVQTKTVTLPAGLEPGKATVALNYSSGGGTLRGMVRWETDRGASEMPFVFTAQKGGDQKRLGQKRLSSSQWLFVDLYALTGAKRAAQNSPSAERPYHVLSSSAGPGL